MKIQTVANCFKKAGFIVKKTYVLENQLEGTCTSWKNSESREEDLLYSVWDGLKQIYGNRVPDDTNDYIAVDDKIETSPHLTDKQIVQVVMDSVVEGEKDTDEEENESQFTNEEKPILKLSDAYTAMRTLHRYGLGCSCPAMEDIIFQLEDILMNQSLKCLRQSKITDYFTANFV